MAILGKIRQRSFFLILVIGLALFAFVISGAFGNGSGDTGPTDPVGVVNDEEISVETFRFLVDQTERSYGYTTMQAVDVVWQQLVRNQLFQAEFETLGIDAGRDQIEQVVSSTESIITNPQFINEAGFFDFGLFTDFIAQLREENPQAYESWKQQEESIISSAREGIYFDLINSSTHITENEAQLRYHLETDNVDLNYVRVPYSSIPDSLAPVSINEVAAYIKKNPSEFEQDASRSLEFVSFSELATEEDQSVIRAEMETLVEDREEYNEVSKLTENIEGFRTTKNLTDFIGRYSEEGFDSIYVPKGKLPADYAEIIFNLGEGEIFGPYKDNNNFKISKLLNRKKDGSIRASHIVISYVDAPAGTAPGVTRTKAEARTLANDIYRQVRRDSDKMAELAFKNSDGPNRTRMGDLGFFQEGQIEEKVFDFANKNRVGRVGLVESDFGFHIIRVTDKEDLVLLASISRKIIPSDETSNKVFKDATQFEMNAAKGDFNALAEESGYNVRSVTRVNELDDALPGLPKQRNIVQWAFAKDTKVGDVKRFSLTAGGYVIVKLTSAREKGLADANDVYPTVSRTLRNEKKAKMIQADNNGIDTLEDLAAKNGVEVVTALAVNQKSGTLVGAGYEPYIVGAAFGVEEQASSDLIKGKNGVFKLQVTAKRISPDLEDTATYINQLRGQERQALVAMIVKALQTAANVEDNRALYY